MNPAATEYWLDERVGVGDPDYALAEAFVAPDRRAAFRLLFGLRAELLDLALTPGDPDPSLARLGWWRQEWERLAGGEPRHPLTLGLAMHGSHESDDLDAALGGVAALLQMDSCETEAELLAIGDAVGQSLGRVESAVFDLEREPAGAWRDIFAADLILQLERLAALGRGVVPLNLGAALQVSRASIQKTPEDLLRLQRVLIERHALQEVEPGAGPSWIYRAIRALRLRALHANGREPGPVRRLLAAWRGRRELG